MIKLGKEGESYCKTSNLIKEKLVRTLRLWSVQELVSS